MNFLGVIGTLATPFYYILTIERGVYGMVQIVAPLSTCHLVVLHGHLVDA